MATTDEARRIDLARQGDRNAFAELVRAHQGPVRAQLRRLSGGQCALADDLAQETFLRAWQSLPRFRGEAGFGTWLYR
ncbi:MAG: sigma factor, partial [Metallibacterium scheffleri]